VSLVPDESSVHDSGHRGLWAAVVLQAKADLENEPVDSVFYVRAAAFFIGTGEWAQARESIAEFLDMHPDDLRSCGRRWINARRVREGLPALPPPLRVQKEPLRLPRLIAVPSESSKIKPAVVPLQPPLEPNPRSAGWNADPVPERPKRRYARRTKTVRAVNPFSPFRFEAERQSA
jgi:hypothetical protein